MFVAGLIIKLAAYFIAILLACFVGYMIKTVIEEIIKGTNEFKEYRKSNKRNN